MRISLIAAIGITVFAIMPLSMSIPVTPSKESSAIGATFVVGIFLHLRNTDWGKKITFRAVWVHYRSHWMTSWTRGVLHGLQLVTLERHFFGVLRNHVCIAKFDGPIEIA
jgi:hypothetical protein